MRKKYMIEIEPIEIEKLKETAEILTAELGVKIKHREAARLSIIRMNDRYKELINEE